MDTARARGPVADLSPERMGWTDWRRLALSRRCGPITRPFRISGHPPRLVVCMYASPWRGREGEANPSGRRLPSPSSVRSPGARHAQLIPVTLFSSLSLLRFLSVTRVLPCSVIFFSAALFSRILLILLLSASAWTALEPHTNMLVTYTWKICSSRTAALKFLVIGVCQYVWEHRRTAHYHKNTQCELFAKIDCTPNFDIWLAAQQMA
jgi:hypothetical protein